MKRIIILLFLTACLIPLFGCNAEKESAQIAATTLPVYEFTSELCAGTDLTVTKVMTENVSCLHDYTLQVRQMEILENAELIVISGAGLETFLDDVLKRNDYVIDASVGIALHCETDTEHQEHNHAHHQDPHYWLSPALARQMAENIYNGLCQKYPAYKAEFTSNFQNLLEKFRVLEDDLQQLAELECRQLITFHDGFSYLAEACDLHIIKSIEEESGSEASAAQLADLCNLVYEYNLPAIFTEKNGSISAASIISAETGVNVFQLDMAISGDSYFEAMQHNIQTLKEALG